MDKMDLAKAYIRGLFVTIVALCLAEAMQRRIRYHVYAWESGELLGRIDGES